MLKIKIVILLMFSMATAYSQSDTIQIKTSAQCSMCKKKLEHDIVYTKGIKSADLDLKTKQLMVIYNPEKISPDKIRKAVSMIGYDADSIPADPKAYKNLNDCCKKGGHDD